MADGAADPAPAERPARRRCRIGKRRRPGACARNRPEPPAVYPGSDGARLTTSGPQPRRARSHGSKSGASTKTKPAVTSPDTSAVSGGHTTRPDPKRGRASCNLRRVLAQSTKTSGWRWRESNLSGALWIRWCEAVTCGDARAAPCSVGLACPDLLTASTNRSDLGIVSRFRADTDHAVSKRPTTSQVGCDRQSVPRPRGTRPGAAGTTPGPSAVSTSGVFTVLDDT